MSGRKIDVVRRFYDAMENREATVMHELFADDIRVWQSTMLPWGGDYEGRDGAFTFFSTLVEHIQSQVSIESLLSAGDHVVQTGRTRGTVVANSASFDIPRCTCGSVGRQGRRVPCLHQT